MKVALYARVSTDDKEQNPETQLIHLRKYADTFNHKIVAEYVDRGKSGRTLKGRKEYQQMMMDAERHKFDAIMGFKLDRFHRNTLNAITFVDQLRGLNVSLILTSQHIDTSTAMGTAMMQITAVFAELESANIAERSKIGTERAIKEGKVCHRPKKVLSVYQIEKAKAILEENPNISHRQLALQFNGISRSTLINGLKEAGVIA
jgi:Site-specific recombinases, DNA invertase Pin homologs